MTETPRSPAVEVRRGHRALRVFIDGKLHLRLDREKLRGFQSWYAGQRPAHTFTIEFYLSDAAPVECQYDREDLWTAIITKVDEVLGE